MSLQTIKHLSSLRMPTAMATTTATTFLRNYSQGRTLNPSLPLNTTAFVSNLDSCMGKKAVVPLTLERSRFFSSMRFYTTPSTPAHSGKYCWKCKTENSVEAIFCKNDQCNTIQVLDPSVTYFSIFGIKEEFGIDLKSLKVKFLKLQQSVHPDNFSTKSDKEKQISEQQSSYINKAYHTLINPLERSIYYLEIKGHGIREEDNVKDLQFLMDVMCINEGIDDAESQQDIDDLSEENIGRINESIYNISEYFKLGKWDAAKEETIKLRYWTNIQNNLKEWTPKK